MRRFTRFLTAEDSSRTRSRTGRRGPGRFAVAISAGVLLGGCAASRPASDTNVESPRDRVVGGWSASVASDPARDDGDLEKARDEEPASTLPRGSVFPSEASVARERQRAVLAVVDSWLGTPYRYGGSTRKGVDCSAFVQSVYRDGLGLGIPRATDHQRDAGTVVDASQIGFGDLVFFRITPRQRHVGIVIGPGEFAHSASSSGVTVSRLDEPYWLTRFDRAVRFDERIAAVIASPVSRVPGAGVEHRVVRSSTGTAQTQASNGNGRTGW